MVTHPQKKKKTTMKPTMKPKGKKPTMKPKGKTTTTTTPKINDDTTTTDDIIATKIEAVENQTEAGEEPENDEDVMETKGVENVTEKSSEESVESPEK